MNGCFHSSLTMCGQCSQRQALRQLDSNSDLTEVRSELQALREENERLKAEQRRIRGELDREGLLRMVNAQATQIGELQARLQKDDKVVGMADAIDFDRETEHLRAQLATARADALEEAAKALDAVDCRGNRCGCADVVRALKGKKP